MSFIVTTPHVKEGWTVRAKDGSEHLVKEVAAAYTDAGHLELVLASGHRVSAPTWDVVVQSRADAMGVVEAIMGSVP